MSDGKRVADGKRRKTCNQLNSKRLVTVGNITKRGKQVVARVRVADGKGGKIDFGSAPDWLRTYHLCSDWSEYTATFFLINRIKNFDPSKTLSAGV